MTRSTATTPHVLATVAALAAHQGAIAARVPQAATPAVAREIESFVARERTVLAALARAAGLGSDAFDDRATRSPAAAVAAVTTSLVPLDQALLADIAVVRSIADRAHVAHIAVAGTDQQSLDDALAEIESFHREWAEWQLTAVSEIAAGAVARLQPTAVQRAAEHARQLAALPAKAAEKAQTAATDLAAAAAEQARTAASEVVGTVVGAVTSASEAVDRARSGIAGQADKLARVTDAAWTAGRDAALRDGDHEAQRTGADATAEVLHETRAGLGVLDESELPVRGYDSLTVPEVVAALAKVRDQKDFRTLDAYERQHKNRKTVLDALEQHSADLVDA